MKNRVVWVWQFMTYFIVGIPLSIMFKVRVRYRFTIKKGVSYIIASNHPRRIDPFLISYGFPLKDFIKLIPFRFITADKYLKNMFLYPFMLLYGCITTNKTSQGTVLERSVKCLNRGETMFIFPSGNLEYPGKHYRPKRGVAYLSEYADNALVIPVNITYSSQTYIEYKPSISLKGASHDLQKKADLIYSKIGGEEK